ncbi:MAG TPA: Fe-S cluster assembly protein SufD [Bacteroidia bacterium]
MNTAIARPTGIPAHLEGEFKTLLSKTFSSEPNWLKEKRKEAFEKFSETGIPSRRSEEYKYTDVKKIFSGGFTAIHNELHKLKLDHSKIFIDKNSIKLIFVNGWLYKDSTLSTNLPKGVVVGNLANEGLLLHSQLLQNKLNLSGDALAQLNHALWTDGALIFIPENCILETPIEILHIATGNNPVLANPRHLIIAEKNSSANIIENNISFELSTSVIVNSHTDISVGENARIRYYRLQNECKNAALISSICVAQEKNSHFDTNTISLENDFVRNNLDISLNGENCESHLNGLFITDGTQHIDNHSCVYHGQPNCQSNQLYKGILGGKSTGVFNGKIFVERDAQKTNAYQSSKNILLSDDSTINTKPELEIYADDVKCSHGSSTGKIDQEALFYLRARGLGEASAKILLLHAFASDVLNTIRDEELKNYLTELIEKNLNG